MFIVQLMWHFACSVNVQFGDYDDEDDDDDHDDGKRQQ